MITQNYANDFKLLTGHLPFPWQESLFRQFVSGKIPRTASMPTGLGKTSIIAVWLLAMMEQPNKMPRRLVYVVNRRTVVDQTTNEVARLREKLPDLNRPGFDSLAISTLRGEFADNGEWRADPSRPAVICGTVDMIGSRLLFEGYRIGFKSRPLHAGFLGQDALLVHDEAHLEPAFQELIETIQCEQGNCRVKKLGNCVRCGKQDRPRDFRPLEVMALSATARSSDDDCDTVLRLTEADLNHRIVTQRVNASKALHLHPCEEDEKELAADVVERALQHRESGNAVLVFLRNVKDAMAALANLKKEAPGHVAPLTGTMRGYERDELVKSNPVFARFMPEADRSKIVTPAEGTVYLVCTSAGEVGANLSADHMVCDLSTFDSMAQRLGRVNRFGNRDDTRIDVVHPISFGKKDNRGNVSMTEYDRRRENTLTLLKQLRGDASPKALGALSSDHRLAAFSPEPTILQATDILFDAWAMTTFKGEMPGRPPVAPYLHGLSEWEPKRTSIAWREDVKRITDEIIVRESDECPRELLAEYPLKPHELLSDRTDRVYDVLQALTAEPNKSVKGEKRKAALDRARKNARAPVWLINESGSVTVTTLEKLLSDEKKRVIRRLEDGTVLLPPSVGGLSAGLLDPRSEHADDVADHWLDDDNQPRRQRRLSDDAQPTSGPEEMVLIRTIDTNPLADEFAMSDNEGEPDVEAASETQADNRAESTRGRFWHWYARPLDAEDATRASARPITWDHHTSEVVNRATQLVEALGLSDELKSAVILAAELHDLGKKREIWQRSIGNPHPENWHAKAGRAGTLFVGSDDGRRWLRGFRHTYRHEFGSLLDAVHRNGEMASKMDDLSDEMRDVVLHLVAAHHGYARPHFPSEAHDHERYTAQQSQDAADEVMRRYARLQRRYGRWGLAYLESLLRAADWAASAEHNESQGTLTEQEATV